MMCQACSEGRHWDCGLQTWCSCDCDPFAYDFAFVTDDEMAILNGEELEDEQDEDDLWYVPS